MHGKLLQRGKTTKRKHVWKWSSHLFTYLNNMVIHQLLPLHSCQTACCWISFQSHQNQNHTYQFLDRKRSSGLNYCSIEFILVVVYSAAWRLWRVEEHTQVQGCLTGGPANATQTLVMAGDLVVVLPWTQKDNRTGKSCKEIKYHYPINKISGSLWNAHILSGLVLNLSQFESACALHTFGDTFCRATAMPLFKLPALTAHSIWTNGCTGENKKRQWGEGTKNSGGILVLLLLLHAYFPPLTKRCTAVIRIHLPVVENWVKTKKQSRLNICRAQTAAFISVHIIMDPQLWYQTRSIWAESSVWCYELAY